MAFNVDVIDNETGEIYREGVLLANAHIFIARENGKIFKEEVDIIELDDIDGGGDIEVRNLWVEFPEIQEEIRKMDAYRKRVQGFWR